MYTRSLVAHERPKQRTNRFVKPSHILEAPHPQLWACSGASLEHYFRSSTHGKQEVASGPVVQQSGSLHFFPGGRLIPHPSKH